MPDLIHNLAAVQQRIAVAARPALAAPAAAAAPGPNLDEAATMDRRVR